MINNTTCIISKLAFNPAVVAEPLLTLKPNYEVRLIDFEDQVSSAWADETQIPMPPVDFEVVTTLDTGDLSFDDTAEVTSGVLNPVLQEPSLVVENIAIVGGLKIKAAPPATLRGAPGDQEGMIRVSDDAIFYCTQDYNGVSDIWVSQPFGDGQIIDVEWEDAIEVTPEMAGSYIRMTLSGFAKYADFGPMGRLGRFKRGQEFTISNRSGSGSLIVHSSDSAFSMPTKTLAIGQTATVKVISSTEADVY